MVDESPKTSPEPEPVGHLDAAFEDTDGPQAGPQRSGYLERPGRRRKLQRELARGEKTMRELAREYGVDHKAITKFRDRHEAVIEDMRQAIDDEFAGLWIAQKSERLAEMIELYDDGTSPRDRETKLSVLRHAAEELGQIPNRTTIDFAQPVHVVIEGGDDV